MEEANRTINILSAENERNRIGRDLHDTLGHTFAMMSLKTELALKQMDKEQYDAARKNLEELNQISRDSMYEVREIVNKLKYRTVAEELLELERLFDLSDIVLTVDSSLDLDSLSPVSQSTLSMVLRELANNVIKHSNATLVRLTVSEFETLYQVIIEDNGKTPSPDIPTNPLNSNTQGIGLINMTERVKKLKGNITFYRQNAFKIYIKIPKH